LKVSCRFREEPDKSDHLNTASMKSAKKPGSYGFLGGLSDLDNTTIFIYLRSTFFMDVSDKVI
jgi:hypothetical protein